MPKPLQTRPNLLHRAGKPQRTHGSAGRHRPFLIPSPQHQEKGGKKTSAPAPAGPGRPSRPAGGREENHLRHPSAGGGEGNAPHTPERGPRSPAASPARLPAGRKAVCVGQNTGKNEAASPAAPRLTAAASPRSPPPAPQVLRGRPCRLPTRQPAKP